MAATIAFTLPISCQICLGRVKEPVVCSNQHVFCRACIDLWLEKNHQCPSCRVPISSENPCRPVLGGLNPDAGPKREESFSNRELRRARMELIYKDYENEIERLQSELDYERHRNDELSRQVKGRAAKETPVSTETQLPWTQDGPLVAILKNKLRDATSSSDLLKADMEKLRKEFVVYKEENALLHRDNQRMRLDLVNRSPRRFGRFTVAALENKLSTSEKEIEQLRKALEKSDVYVDELEKQLASSQRQQQRTKPKSEDGRDETESETSVDASERSVDDVDRTFSDDFCVVDDDHSKTRMETSASFVLDLPSGISADSVLSKEDAAAFGDETSGPECRRTDRKKQPVNSSFSLEIPSPSTFDDDKKASPLSEWLIAEEKRRTDFKDAAEMRRADAVDSCKKKLRFAAGSSDDFGRPDDRRISDPSELQPLRVAASSDYFCDDGGVRSQPDMNASMTPEMEDCIRLMDEAERKVRDRTMSQNPQIRSFVDGPFFSAN